MHSLHCRIPAQGSAGAPSLQESFVPHARGSAAVLQWQNLQLGDIRCGNPTTAVPKPTGRHLIACQDHRGHGHVVLPAGFGIFGGNRHTGHHHACHGMLYPVSPPLPHLDEKSSTVVQSYAMQRCCLLWECFPLTSLKLPISVITAPRIGPHANQAL